MLYDILLMAFAVHIMLTPLFMAKALQYGIKLGQRPEEAAKTPVLNITIPKKRPRLTREQKEEKRQAAQKIEETIAILENVDNFDGTGFGQKEIKHGNN